MTLEQLEERLLELEEKFQKFSNSRLGGRLRGGSWRCWEAGAWRGCLRKGG